jgi:hypothetical protein
MFEVALMATRLVRKLTRSVAWLIALPLALPAILAGLSTTTTVGAVASPAAKRAVPAYCQYGGQRLWDNLVSCGWPGKANTGPVMSDCQGHQLIPEGNGTNPIVLNTPNQVVRCADLRGKVTIKAANVTIINSAVETRSGSGSASITIDVGASAKISHVTINGGNRVHACIWHQGTRLLVKAVNCFGVKDGIFAWAVTNLPSTGGDHYTIMDSYFHGFTREAANSHEDGFQTEGSNHGLVKHNTFRMTTGATSAVAIWDSRANSNDISVKNNLIAGGGFAVYAEDYNPSDGAPGDPSAAGGFSVTNIQFDDNAFSTVDAGCVGKYGVWFTRPTWEPYQGGPTDGWHRLGNVVLETGENIDMSNPYSGGQLCR